jgi:hypothetical protein
MGIRPFRWLPHDGRRHAIKADLIPRDQTSTLCGKDLAVPDVRATKNEWCWPTCADCDTAWRAAEGIPGFSRQSRREIATGQGRRAL